MRQHFGTFITWDSSNVSVDSSYVSSVFPRKIAIICNQYNGSTDESFLMQVKQSSKVKVFGRPTSGALDFSNIHIVDFPNGLFQLIYTMTASYRIPDFPIDGIGIQPDFYIDDSIHEEDWIYYVQSTMESWPN
jgi:C-terminal processing protease CtpA/Prc